MPSRGCAFVAAKRGAVCSSLSLAVGMFHVIPLAMPPTAVPWPAFPSLEVYSIFLCIDALASCFATRRYLLLVLKRSMDYGGP